jgi:hypothetical protein
MDEWSPGSVREGQGTFGNTADVASDAAFADDLIPTATVNKLDLDHGSGPDDARTPVKGLH